MGGPLEIYRGRVREGALAPDPAQQEAVVELQRLYDQLAGGEQAGKWTPGVFLGRVLGGEKAPRQVRGVYLWGDVGRGKTMLMDLFYGSLPDTVPKRRTHFHAFMIEVHDWLHRRRGARVDTLLPDLAAEIAAAVRVLCFDEFHVSDVADAMLLGRLFAGLFDRGIAVVATSNFAPAELYRGGLQRDRFEPFIELLKQRTEVVRLRGGADYRARYLSEEGVYFTPLGEAARRRAEEVFAHLTEGAPVESRDLVVKGRTIHVPGTAAGVARFSFAELCERPHGAEDYLSIASAYHTVFVEGVPKMNYDRRNEARRFMILIDTFYDRGVKLVVTADAEPERLYLGHDHAFEFQRTVSRLNEMRSRAYLEK